MPRNPVNDVRAGGTMRSKASDTVGPADEFQSRTIIDDDGVVSQIGNHGLDRARVYGDGRSWFPIQAATPTSLVPGQFFIETVSPGSDQWAFVNSLGVIEYLASSIGGANTEIQFNDSGVFAGDPHMTWNKTTDVMTLTQAGSTVLRLARITTNTGVATIGAYGDRGGANTYDALQIGNAAATGQFTVQLTDAGLANLVGSGITNQLNVMLPVSLTVGSAASPALAFTGDLNTGLYWVGADQLGVSTGGTLRVTVSTTGVTSTLPFIGAVGSAALPQYTFTGDLNTGLYWVGADQLGVSTGGTLRLDVSTTAITAALPIVAAVGAVGAPSITFTGDLNTGLYWVGADQLGVSTGGTLRVTVSTTALTSTLIGVFPATTTAGASIRLPHGTVPTSPVNGDLWSTTSGFYGQVNGFTVGPFSDGTGTVSGAGAANQVAYWTGTSVIASDAGMVYDATNDQLALAAGTAALPSYAIIGDLDTGMYGVGANNLGFSVGGTLRLDVSTTAVTSALPIVGPAGLVGTPSFTLVGDLDTGLYSVGANDLGIATGGALRLDVSTTAITATLPYYAPAGLVGTPSITFSGDTNTGLYWVGADDLGISVGGTLRVDISTTAVTSTIDIIAPNFRTTASNIIYGAGSNTALATTYLGWNNTSSVVAAVQLSASNHLDFWSYSGSWARSLRIADDTTVSVYGNLTMPTVGSILSIKEGANGRMGETTLVGGTVSVLVASITTSTRCMLTRHIVGGTVGTQITYACTAGTLTITSDNPLDTSTFTYLLIDPA